MLNRIIQWALNNRLFVAAGALLLLIYGVFVVIHLPVDVLPDLNRPTVTVMAEAEGLSPEEVEALVTLPIESLLNGATNVQRVRSFSGVGLSIVFIEFDWGSNIYIDRQLVSEKLQLAAEKIPEGISPVMGPISSIMGEIMLVGLSSESTPPIEVRTLAEWVIRPRLLSIPGVAQVISIGGGLKQYQVNIDPAKLKAYGISLKEATEAVEASNVNTTGGFLEKSSQEYLIRNVGRITTIEELESSVVAYRNGTPVFLKQIASVGFGPQVKRGDGSVNGKPAVIMSIQKQPGANTVELTKRIDKALEEIQRSLPPDVKVHKEIFRQSNFIEAAIKNVEEALRDGALIVAIVLFCFLMNFRTTFITLTAIPLSFIITFLFMKLTGMSINTMTLGGLAIAIGELVDDAIVDLENVFRRLKENVLKEKPENPLVVIYHASSEIRNSIVYATIVIMLVFLPFFFLSGVEGRLFQPIGVAYIVSLVASLLVSLTVTPVLCSYLLPNARFMRKEALTEEKKDSPLVRWLKKQDLKLLHWTLKHPWKILTGTSIIFLIAISLFPFMGKEFLPEFNEGSATINLLALPGTSLAESNKLGTVAEKRLLEIPEVASTARRTGRAELDEHAEGVHYSEIDVLFKKTKRSKEAVLHDIRDKLSQIPGTVLNIGQPISHRIDHLLSGIRAQVAVKIFGTDLTQLRAKAAEVEQVMGGIKGVVDLQIEKQVLIPQILIRLKREKIARYGLRVGEVSELLETALNGKVVSEVLEQQRTFDVLVRLDEPWRNDLETISKVLIDTPTGAKIPINQVAEVREDRGPNVIARENVQRRIVIQCNAAGRDLGSIIKEMQKKIASQVHLPEGYFITYGGQFESQQQASRLILFLSLFTIVLVFLLLYSHFKSSRIALQVMVNLPVSTIGGVVAVFLTGGTLSIASLVGFVTVFGIASRNGIMMISHYLHLMKEEGENFDEKMIIRGSIERLVPVLMTAATAALGLIPIALFGHGQTGKEILFPVATVILGGLISSTLLDMAVTPALFFKFGRPAAEKILAEREGGEGHRE